MSECGDNDREAEIDVATHSSGLQPSAGALAAPDGGAESKGRGSDASECKPRHLVVPARHFRLWIRPAATAAAGAAAAQFVRCVNPRDGWTDGMGASIARTTMDRTLIAFGRKWPVPPSVVCRPKNERDN